MDLLEPLALSLAMGAGPELAPVPVKAHAGHGVSGTPASSAMSKMVQQLAKISPVSGSANGSGLDMMPP